MIYNKRAKQKNERGKIMIKVQIDETTLLDLFMDRLEYWTTDNDVLSLYEDYLKTLIDCGAFEDSELNINNFIDNLYVNDAPIMDKEELEAKKIDIDDADKMADFLKLSKEEFLQSYSYLTEFEYDETRNQFNNSKAEILADLMRTAENLLLEESNDRPTGCEVTGEQLKVIVANYALNNLATSEYKDFEDICGSMGC